MTDLPGAITRKLTSGDWQEAEKLLTAAGWLEAGTPPETVGKMLAGTEAVGIIIPGKGLVAMGRGISDGCSDGYIQDVFVLPEYRGAGLGRKVVKALIAALKAEGCDWIGLISTPGNEDFYKNLGFEVMDGHTPMLLNEKR